VSENSDKAGLFNGKGKDVLVILGLIIIFSLLLEQTIRFYIFGSDSFSYQQMKSIKSAGRSGFLKESENDEIVYELKPNIDSDLKLASVKTNSLGLRDKEYSVQKPENTFRVAVIGGSFTFGSGVEIENTYHSRLEDRLNNESEDLRYEFINFGVSGYTMRNKLATLKYKVLDYNPDLVLFVLDGSQFTDEEYRKFVPKPVKNHFFTSYVYTLISKNKIFKSVEKRASEFTQDQLDHLDNLNQALTEISEVSKDNSISICIVVLDHDYLHLELANKIETLVEKNHLYFANTIPAFKGTNFNDYTIYRVDFHPNAKANKLFSESIYNDLVKQSLLDKPQISKASN